MQKKKHWLDSSFRFSSVNSIALCARQRAARDCNSDDPYARIYRQYETRMSEREEYDEDREVLLEVLLFLPIDMIAKPEGVYSCTCIFPLLHRMLNPIAFLI